MTAAFPPPAVAQARSRFLGVVSSSPFLAVPALILLALLAFAPGIAELPLLDRDEARFAQATKQMHESGDYIDIRFQGEPRHQKPIGAYWAQAAATAGFGGASAPVFAYRLPSLLGAVLAVLGTYAAGLALFGRRAALLAGVMTAAMLTLAVEARIAKADALLTGATALAFAVLARAWSRGGEGEAGAMRLGPIEAGLFWPALGVGILVKGPIILMIVGLALAALLAYGRSLAVLRALRPLAGLAILAAIVLPWLIAIGLRSDGAFFAASLGRDLGAKLAAGQEGHGAPPGTHLAVLPFGTWPAAAFILLALPYLWGAWRERPVFFTLAWVLPAFLVFEATPTKLPHYTLPLYPALALAAGAAIDRDRLAASKAWRRGLALLAVLLPVGVGAAAVAGLIATERRLPAGLDVAVVLAIGFSIVSAAAIWRDRLERAVLLAALSGVALYAGVFRAAAPAADTLFPTDRIMAAVEGQAGCAPAALASSGYSEPSLVFAAGTQTLLAPPADVAAWLAGEGCRVALVETRQDAAFREAAAALGLPLRQVGTVDGFNYSRGRFQTVALYRRAG